MLNGMDSSALWNTAYAITQMDIHIILTDDNRSFITTNFHYIPTDDYHGDPLILKGKKLKLFNICLDGAPIDYKNITFSKHNNTIIIANPPAQGDITIAAEFSMESLLKLPGVFNFAGNIVFTSVAQNLEYLTYIIPQQTSKSIYNIRFTANLSKYPLLLAPGTKKLQRIDAQQNQTLQFEDAKLKTQQEVMFMLGKSCSIQDCYFSLEENPMTITLYTQANYLGAARLAFTTIKSCAEWYERDQKKTINTNSYNIVAIPSLLPEYFSGSNILFCAEFQCLATLSTATDASMTNIVAFLAREFFRNIDSDNADELQRKFLQEYFGSCKIPTYAHEYNTQQMLLDYILQACTPQHELYSIELPYDIISGMKDILKDASIPNAIKAQLLSMPTVTEIIAKFVCIDIHLLQRVLRLYTQFLGVYLEDEWFNTYNNVKHYDNNEFTAHDVGTRKLKNLALWYLLAIPHRDHYELALTQILVSANLNDRFRAFESMSYHDNFELSSVDTEMQQYLTIKSNDAPFAINSNLLLTATLHEPDTYRWLHSILTDGGVNDEQKYLLLTRFTQCNWEMFHHASGAGYKLFINSIAVLDQQNPTLARKLLLECEIVKKFDIRHMHLLHKELCKISDQDLSPDLHADITSLLRILSNNLMVDFILTKQSQYRDSAEYQFTKMYSISHSKARHSRRNHAAFWVDSDTVVCAVDPRVEELHSIDCMGKTSQERKLAAG